MKILPLLRPAGILLALAGFAAACYAVGLPWGKGGLLPLLNAPLLDDQTLANYNQQLPAVIRWIAVAGFVAVLAGVFLRWVRLPVLLAGLMAGLAAGPFIELWNDLQDLDRSQRERNEAKGFASESIWKKVVIKSGTYCLLGGSAAAVLGAWLAGGRNRSAAA